MYLLPSYLSSPPSNSPPECSIYLAALRPRLPLSSPLPRSYEILLSFLFSMLYSARRTTGPYYHSSLSFFLCFLFQKFVLIFHCSPFYPCSERKLSVPMNDHILPILRSRFAPYTDMHARCAMMCDVHSLDSPVYY
jgi:hypothetical protein